MHKIVAYKKNYKVMQMSAQKTLHRYHSLWQIVPVAVLIVDKSLRVEKLLAVRTFVVLPPRATSISRNAVVIVPTPMAMILEPMNLRSLASSVGPTEVAVCIPPVIKISI